MPSSTHDLQADEKRSASANTRAYMRKHAHIHTQSKPNAANHTTRTETNLMQAAHAVITVTLVAATRRHIHLDRLPAGFTLS